ncbi:MAG TPA: cohesin domain-containing protein [Candidatus Methylomirabilis sp.]|nr:cohesin domain-containing protein [Candidatus Methylomirabilis sp.]
MNIRTQTARMMSAAIKAAVTFALAALPLSGYAAGSSVLSLSGPSKVSAGQVFSVQVKLDPKGDDIDTVRINGTYPKDQIRWIGATLGGDFPSSAPNTYFDEGSGRFSIGAFRIGSGVRKATTVATITFRARANGNVKIVLDSTSKAISAGEDRLLSALSWSLSIGGQTVGKATVEQPALLPTKEQVAKSPALASMVRISSLSHPDPDTWYPTRDVTVSWESAGMGIKQSLFSMDGSAESTPRDTVQGRSVTQALSRDGIWFAHVKILFEDGTSQLDHLRLQVDSTPPRRPAPIAEQDLVPPTVPNAIRYGTTDDASGVAKYKIALAGRTFDVADPSFPLPPLEPGVHVASVTAVDRAGNESSNDVSIEVVPGVTVLDTTGSRTLGAQIASWWDVFGKPGAALLIVACVAVLLALPWIWFIPRRKKRTRS